MTIEDQILELAAKADALRPLPDGEPAKEPLAALVDRINALRAQQATADPSERRATVWPVIDAVIEGADARPVDPSFELGYEIGALAERLEHESAVVVPPKRRPGRPKKGAA
ncbi:MAG: hypothetical protein V4792_09775 [Pseudomonadota bacterium]